MAQDVVPLAVPIIIDSREQKPYAFTGHRTVCRKLDAGDYSLEGYEGRIAVERKSKEDAWGSVGKARFERALLRLGEVERPFLVIESTLEQFVIPPAYVEQRTAQATLHFYLSRMVRLRVPVVWAPSRAWAEMMIVCWFRKFLEHCV